jgi:hypothetical protein
MRNAVSGEESKTNVLVHRHQTSIWCSAAWSDRGAGCRGGKNWTLSCQCHGVTQSYLGTVYLTSSSSSTVVLIPLNEVIAPWSADVDLQGKAHILDHHDQWRPPNAETNKEAS